MTNEEIARVAHEVNRALCEAAGDNSQPVWESAPEWQKTSALNGVAFHAANPNASPSASHDNWLAEKKADGWTYGEVKDPEAKTHPAFVPYDDLPFEQRVKDYAFRAVCQALIPRQQPIPTEARQVTPENGGELAKWCNGTFIPLYGRGDRGEDISHIVIRTPEGDLRAHIGDFIIPRDGGNFEVMGQDVYARTFDQSEAPLS